MRVLRFVCLVAAVAVVVFACGSSKEEEAAKAAQQAAEKAADAAAAASGDATAAAKGLTDLAKSMEEAGKALSAMGGGDGKPVEPVSFRELQKYLPEVSGWEMGKPEGQKMTSPFPFAESEVSYSRGDSSVEAKIVDSGFNQILFAPFTMFMVQGYERETSSGWEKSVTVAGAQGFEKWDSEAKEGELTLVVGKRFLVSLKGRGIDDTNVLREFAGRMNLGGLAGLK